MKHQLGKKAAQLLPLTLSSWARKPGRSVSPRLFSSPDARLKMALTRGELVTELVLLDQMPTPASAAEACFARSRAAGPRAGTRSRAWTDCSRASRGMVQHSHEAEDQVLEWAIDGHLAVEQNFGTFAVATLAIELHVRQKSGRYGNHDRTVRRDLPARQLWIELVASSSRHHHVRERLT